MLNLFASSNISIITQIQGFQYTFEKNKFYIIENLNSSISKELFFNKVLCLSWNDKLFLGTPYLNNIKIKVKILDQVMEPKIITYKMKPKKGIRKKSGFSKKKTKIFISDIFFKKIQS